MYPQYEDIEIPLLLEIFKRGGVIKPSEKKKNFHRPNMVFGKLLTQE